MKRRLVLFPALCLVFAAIAGSWETSGFRSANGKLIVPGMQKSEVRRDAGKPLDGKELTAVEKSSRKNKKQGEVWTYRGSDGIYSLTFAGDKLYKIEVTPNR